MAEQKWTKRMSEIIRLMRDEGAIIYESRDAFMERSSYSLEAMNQPGDPGYGKSAHKIQQNVTEDMVLRLAPYLLEGRKPVKKNGKYVTSQSTYYYPDHPGIPREADGYEPSGDFDVTFPRLPLPEKLQREGSPS
jgi:hypothetical protein